MEESSLLLYTNLQFTSTFNRIFILNLSPFKMYRYLYRSIQILSSKKKIFTAKTKVLLQKIGFLSKTKDHLLFNTWHQRTTLKIHFFRYCTRSS